MERAVVGVDFSPASAAALRWVCHELLPQATLDLVHVLPAEPRPSFATGPAPTDAAVSRAAEAAAHAALAQLARDLCPAAGLHVCHGRPPDELARAAQGAHLIVVGEHRQAHGPFNILGSTAEQLVRCGRVPVLLARALPPGRPGHILAAIDDSPLGARVLRWADALAERLHASVSSFYTLPRIYAHLRMVSSPSASQRVDRAMLAQAQGWLREQTRTHAGSGRMHATDVVEGDPAQEILAAARRLDAELIVLGSRGAGAFNRAVVGSVAQSVLRGAACPVVVISRQTRE